MSLSDLFSFIKMPLKNISRFWSIKLVAAMACLLPVLLVLDILTVPDPLLATILAAFLLLVIPGFLLSRLIWGQHHPLLDQLALAFGLSVGLWITPGALMLWLHGNLTVMIGVVLIITLLLAVATLFRSQPDQPTQAKLKSANAPTTTGGQTITSREWPRLVYWAAFVVSLAVVLYVSVNAATLHRGDRCSYQAFLRHFLDSKQFLTKGFRISSTLVMVTPRDLTHTWLVLLALVIKLAQVDLLDAYVYYLPPLLILVSFFVLYAFAKELFNSQITALTACLVQTLYYLSNTAVHEGVGYSLFRRVIEDKFLISFILLPVALWLTLRYLKHEERGSLVGLIIIITALTLVHPLGVVLYAISFGLFLLVMLLFGSWSEKKEILVEVGPVIVAILVVLLVPLWQRQQMASAVSATETFELEAGLNSVVGDVRGRRLHVLLEEADLYIASPGLIAHPLVILAILLTPLLLKYLRARLSAQFLFANMAGVLLLCYTPFLAPLLGKVITPWLIWRVLWLLPVSLVISFFLSEATRALTNHFGQVSSQWLQLVPLSVVLVGALLLRGEIVNGLDRLERLKSWALTAEERAVLAYLREHGTPGSVIMTPNTQLSNEIPGLVGHSYGITFRGAPPLFASAPEDRTRFYEAKFVTNAHLDILRQYNIKYVILKAETELAGQFKWLSSIFKPLYTNGVFELYEVPPDPGPNAVVAGNTHLVRREWDEAITEYKEALKFNSEDTLAHFGLAQAYQARGKMEQAEGAYLDAINADWYNVPARAALAQVYVAQGRAEEAIRQYEEAIGLRPDYLALHGRLGDIYLMQGRVDEAVGEYEQTIDFPPGTADYHSELGFLLYSKGLNERAIEEYLKAMDLDSYSSLAYYRLGTVYLAEERLDDAMEAYERAIKIRPDDVAARVGIGRVYEAQGAIEKAFAQYRKTIKMNPYIASPYLALGNLYQDQGEIGEAIAAYQQAIAMQPKCASCYIRLGEAYEARGESEQAIAEYQRAIEIDPDSAAPYVALGNLYAAEGKTDEAITAYRQAMAVEPDCLASYIRIGNLYKDQGEIGEAIAAYQQAIVMQPECADCYFKLGEAYRVRGENEQAIAEYQRAIEIDPDSAATYVALGDLYAAEGRTDEALAVYRKAMAVEPDYLPSYIQMGRVFEDRGEMEMGIASYRDAIVRFPDSPWPYLALGDLYRGEKRLEEALTAYQQAVMLNPDYIRGHIGLGAVYRDLGDLEKTLTVYQRAMAIEPDNQSLWKAFPPLSLEQPMRIRLGDSVRFLGYAADSANVEANESLHLTFYWQGLERMDTSCIVFVHLLGENGQIWGQEDTPLCQGDYPTASWPLETVISDEHEITIDPQTPPGEYMLEIGMYDVATGEHLVAYNEQLGEWLPGARILLGKVVVR